MERSQFLASQITTNKVTRDFAVVRCAQFRAQDGLPTRSYARYYSFPRFWYSQSFSRS
jgi:hypothetical protein